MNLISPTGHVYDRTAMQMLLNDPEVKEWLAGMGEMAFLPVKR